MARHKYQAAINEQQRRVPVLCCRLPSVLPWLTGACLMYHFCHHAVLFAIFFIAGRIVARKQKIAASTGVAWRKI